MLIPYFINIFIKTRHRFQNTGIQEKKNMWKICVRFLQNRYFIVNLSLLAAKHNIQHIYTSVWGVIVLYSTNPQCINAVTIASRELFFEQVYMYCKDFILLLLLFFFYLIVYIYAHERKCLWFREYTIQIQFQQWDIRTSSYTSNREVKCENKVGKQQQNSN